MLYVRLLGPFEASCEGRAVRPPSARARALLQFLAWRGRPALRTEIATLLWGSERLQNLRQELYVLRRCPGAAGWLQQDEARIGVVAETDVHRLRALLQEGRLDAARALLGAPALEDLPESPGLDDWADEVRREVDGLVAGLAEAHQDTPQRLAQALALCEDVPPTPILAELLGLSTSAVLAGLEALERDHQLGRGGLTPRARQAALKGGSPLTQAASLRRLAELREAQEPGAAAAHWRAVGEPDRAARALRAAGRLDEALDVAREPELTRDLLLESLRVEEAAGAVSDALAGRLEDHARRTQDPRAIAEALRWRAHRALRAGRADAALDAAEEAVATARAHRLADLVPVAEAARGRVLVHVGRWEEAAAPFEAALDGPPAARMVAHSGLGALHGRAGRLDAAVEHHRAAVTLARELGDVRSAAASSLNLGCDLERLGRYEAAQGRFEEAALAFSELGERWAGQVARANLAQVLRYQGRLADSLRIPQSLLAEATDPQLRGLALDAVGEVERACGLWEQAAATHREAAACYRHSGGAHHQRLAELNAEVAELEGGLPPGPALWRLRRGEALGELTAHVAIEAALWAADPAFAAPLLAAAAPTSPYLRRLGALAAWRAARLRGETLAAGEPVLQLAATPCPEQPLALLAAARPIRSAVDTLGEGLPEALREGLARRPARWSPP